MEDEVTKKCPSCGEKVAANARFCSVCGTALANFCPNCGQARAENARFCANCGYAFVREDVAPVRQPSVVAPVEKKREKPIKEKTNTGRLGKALRIIPAVTFALFALLTFIFYFAPMVKMPIVGGLGNLYQFMGGEKTLKAFGLQGLAITYFLVSVVILGLSIAYILVVLPYQKGYITRKRKLVSTVFSWGIIVVYLAFVITSIVLSVRLREKMACSSSVATLIIIFSILFALLSGTCNVLCLTRVGTIPDLEQEEAQPVTQKEKKEKKKTLGVWGKVFRIIPALLFALFAVLTFVFYCTPMIKRPQGSMGNLYEVMGKVDMKYKESILEAFGLQGFPIVYILLSIVALGIAVLYVLAVTPYGRRMRARDELFLSDVLSWLVLAVYVAFLIISIMVTVTLGGRRNTVTSPMASLLIVFSIIFAVLSLTCNVLGCTRFGARCAMPPITCKPTPPAIAELAQMKEEGELENVTVKYLQAVRRTAKFVVWMVFVAVLSYIFLIVMEMHGMDFAQAAIPFTIVLAITLVLFIVISKLMNKVANPLKKHHTYRIALSKAPKRWAIGLGICGGYFLILGSVLVIIDIFSNQSDGHMALDGAICIVSSIGFICAFVALCRLHSKRKKTLNHPAVKPVYDLCTYIKLLEMASYLKAIKRYEKAEKLYNFYLYDMKKYEIYLAYTAKQ